MEPVITVCLNPAVDRILEVRDFRAGEHQSGRSVLCAPAGKGVNIARALASLGVSSIVTGFVGEDRFDEFEQSINETGRSTAQFLRVVGKTRENITIVDPSGERDTHIRLEGLEVTEQQLGRFARKLNLLARKDRVVVFAGSLPANMGTARFRELVEACVVNGARVVVESDAAAMEAVRDLGLWLIKPSVERLGAMVGAPVPGEPEIVRYGLELSETIRTVMVTCGASGAYLFVDGSAMLGQVKIAEERMGSTVGCGDCMLAGFLAARLCGADVRESFRRSLAAAGAAAVSVEPGRMDESAIEEFLSDASVVAVKAGRGGSP